MNRSHSTLSASKRAIALAVTGALLASSSLTVFADNTLPASEQARFTNEFNRLSQPGGMDLAPMRTMNVPAGIKVSGSRLRSANAPAEDQTFVARKDAFRRKFEKAGKKLNGKATSQDNDDAANLVDSNILVDNPQKTNALGFKVYKPQVDANGTPVLDANGQPVLVGPKDVPLRSIYHTDAYRKADLENEKTGSTQPWSDDYWAIGTGLTANRYGDPEFASLSDKAWTPEGNVKWAALEAQLKLSESINQSNPDNASPAEKYDMLVGDADMSLTRAQKQISKSSVKPDGTIEGWMGICHGWSPAAFMERRSQKAQIVTTATGKRLKFYPADIKALASLLWANGTYTTKFIGQRCNVKNPTKDPISGRVQTAQKGETAGGCFDTNPGTWHKAIVNQIGYDKDNQGNPRKGRSFVIDATYDYEVWNQPMKGYSFYYFNPITKEVSAKLGHLGEEGSPAIKYEALQAAGDKFEKYRGTGKMKPTYVVGIFMDVTYMVETEPKHLERDNASNDATKTVTYAYDLELDQNGAILGGEWYTNVHPDFLWSVDVDQVATSKGDEKLIAALEATGTTNPQAPKTEKVSALVSQWQSPSTAMPEEWSREAISSSKSNQPLAVIVKSLINFTQ